MESLTEEKRRLRTRMRDLRSQYPPAERTRAADSLTLLLRNWDTLARATTLLASMAMGDEIDLRRFCEEWLIQGKRLALPRVNEDGISLSVWGIPDLDCLMPGYRGVLEPDPKRCLPLSPAELEVALIPGLAFDRLGGRLGRGKGHFDRWLGLVADAKLETAGVCFDFQVVDHVPSDPQWDRKVSWLATPSGLYRCSQ